MRWLRAFQVRLRTLLRPGSADARMDAEFAFHLEMEIAKQRARGLSPGAARRAALLAFGGQERYRTEMREGRGFHWLFEGLRDARWALRQLRRQPVFAFAAILSLALAMGATTAVFSLMRQVVFEPLPYPESSRIVQLATRYAGWGVDYGSVSEPEVLDLATLSSFESVAAYRGGAVDAAGPAGAERLRGLYASTSLLRVLRVAPLRGRAFSAHESLPGGPAVALVTERAWRRLDGSSGSAPVGGTILLNAVPHTIVGVLDASFDFANAEIVLPLRSDPAAPRSRGAHDRAVVGRLAGGVSFERATRELAELSARLRSEHTRNYTPDMRWELVARPLHAAVLGNAGLVLRLLAGAVLLVLLGASANVANLLLARLHRRAGEFALRSALGASRSRLVRQLLAEALVLSGVSALAGLIVATLGANLVLASAPDALPRAQSVPLDAGLLLTAFYVSCATTIAFGILPALRMTRAARETTWQTSRARGASAGGWGRGNRAMASLLSVQLAFAVLVVIGAGLLLRSYARLTRVDLGFRPDNVVAFDITLPEAGYTEPERVTRFFQELTDRLAREQGVTNAGGVLSLPLRSGTGNIDIELEGRAPAPGESAPSPTVQIITPGYAATMRIALLAGRLPRSGDDDRAPLVAWVNQAAAERLWPGERATGQRFRLRGDTTDSWFTVAGVFANVHTTGVERMPVWEYYIMHAQLPRVLEGSELHRALSIVLRMSSAPETFAPRARQVLRELDARVAPARLETMDAVVARALARPRLLATLLGAFALLAVALAAVGVYGVLAFLVSGRTREIGIRLALGASRSEVIRTVARDGLRAALLGLCAGAITAAAAGQLIRTQLHGVSAHDPLVYTFSIGALLALVFASALIPAGRAARLHPADTLRGD